MDLDHKQVQLERPLRRAVWNMEMRYRARKNIQGVRFSNSLPETDMATEFINDPVIQAMRKPYTQQFFQNFQMGLLNYIQGEWHVARKKLELTLKLLEDEDGPSKALLAYMQEEFNFERPDWWDGVHEPPGGPAKAANQMLW